jgi:NAD(P)-dependent dehydrogenase (short-subunit alcohol dehydrogenase family)
MKTALITGARGGIGSAVIRALLARDDYRIVAATQPDTISDSQVQIKDAGKLIQKAVDLSSYDEIAKLGEWISEEKLDFDWLIFAHGFIDDETVLESQRPDDILMTFQLNVLSVVYLCQLLLKHVKKGGGIICVSSTAALSANGHYAAYSASKAAVNNFVQALARNRPDRSIFAVCPGPTKTQMLEKIGGDSNTAQNPTAVSDAVTQIMSQPAEYKSGDIIVVRDGHITLAGRL